MDNPLRTLESDVAAAERRLELRRIALSAQASRTWDAVEDRLSRPDALIASAGLGALYGLWVSRPAQDGTNENDQGSDTSRWFPGLIARTALSMLITHFLSDSSEDSSDPGPEELSSMGIHP